MMKIGARLKQLRKENGYTQEMLAKRLNVTPQTVYKYERGVITNIPSDKVEQIAKLFKVSPAYIMGWSSKGLAKSIKSKGISPSELSEMTGISVELINRYIDNSLSIPENNLKIICTALDITEKTISDSDFSDTYVEQFEELSLETKRYLMQIASKTQSNKELKNIIEDVSRLNRDEIESLKVYIRVLVLSRKK